MLNVYDDPEPLPEALRERPDLVDDRRRPPILVLAARKPTYALTSTIASQTQP